MFYKVSEYSFGMTMLDEILTEYMSELEYRVPSPSIEYRSEYRVRVLSPSTEFKLLRIRFVTDCGWCGNGHLRPVDLPRRGSMCSSVVYIEEA